MHVITAYERRDQIRTDDLGRLRSALVDEVERYRLSIRGYAPDKMRDYGAPFLAELEGRVEEVSRILASRSANPA